MFKKISARIPSNTLKQYSKGEEIANSVIHGLGILFGIVSLTVLLTLSSLFGTAHHFICYLIYGLSMILLYTSSTLYHAIPHMGAKKFFKVCDHVSIYLLIAGTYTPFLIINIQGSLGWILLALIWSSAFFGIIFKFFYVGRFTFMSTLFYLAMGWMAIIATKPLSESLSSIGMAWIVAGGIAYTLGTIFYLMKKVRFHHAIWHLFVLAGSVFHFTAIVYSANFS
jgi:hemolysin III